MFLPTPLRLDQLRRALAGTRFGREIHGLGIVSSTSDLLLARSRSGAVDGSVVLADGQTQGRGRQGRAWLSPPRSGLLLSILLRGANFRPEALAAALGVAVAETLEEFGVVARLKWPNDLWLGRRKAGGILVDAIQEGTERICVIGIGLNVHAAPPPCGVGAGHPGISLDEFAPTVGWRRETILVSLLRRLETRLSEAALEDHQELSAAYAARDGLRGAWVRASEGPSTVEGVVVSVDPFDGLELRDLGGSLRRLRAALTHVEAVRFSDA